MNIMSSSKGDPERLPDLTEADVERYAGQWGFDDGPVRAVELRLLPNPQTPGTMDWP